MGRSGQGEGTLPDGAESEERGRLQTDFQRGLHDLCQPLTALQCRLYLGTSEEATDALQQTIRDSLVECERVMLQVRQLQDCMQELEGKYGGSR